MSKARSFKLSKIGLLSLCVATASSAIAQGDSAEVTEEVVVTGYRGSLLNSTNAKRNSVGFSDEVFADDIGKMPSQNLAESLSRIPGVRINREVTGEGQQITVRGLGPDFTKVVLNGNSMAVASMGDMNANANGRQVDLNTFPTELFRSLSVSKTATASQIEGGVSGYVNMRTLRASDFDEGHNFRFALDGMYKEATKSTSPKAVLGYSFSDDKFGALVTIVNQSNDHGVDGSEVVGNVYQPSCLIDDMGGNGCRSGAGSGLRHNDVATADFVAANPGYSVGDILDVAAITGLTAAQTENVNFPYIHRLATTNGERSTTSALVSLEYKPNDDLSFALDVINSDSENDYVRDEFMEFYRRNYGTPPHVMADVTLGNNNTIKSGTFYGSTPWIGSRDYIEELSFTSIMPSMQWQISDTFRMDGSFSKTDSDFSRDDLYALVFAAPGTMTYDNNGIVSQVDHNNLDAYDSYFTHTGEDRFRYEYMERETETKGFHLDFYLGEDPDANGFKFGISSDEIATTRALFDPDPNVHSDLDANDDGAVNANEYAADAITTMQANMGDYIRTVEYGNGLDSWNGLSTFGAIDFGPTKSLMNYSSLVNIANRFTDISEKVTSLYVEANTETNVGGHTLRTNSGVRLVSTDQHVEDQTGRTDVEYDRILPSFSVVYDATDDIKIRASASRSLSRANPANMYPGATWDGSGIDKVRVGNPGLAPFESTNFDFGGEWYFGDLGYVGVTYYEKNITGFTYEDELAENLNDLGDWGVDLDALSATQIAARDICDPNCTVAVVTRVNTQGTSTLTGTEIVWVQPLDMILEGFGFNASANNINDKSPEGAEITGISDSNNFTIYYENESFQTRLTYFNQDAAVLFNSWGFDVTSEDRAQIDFSASYNLPVLEDYNLTLTFDAYNLNNEPLASIQDGDPTQSFNVYYPGTTYTFGIRGSF